VRRKEVTDLEGDDLVGRKLAWAPHAGRHQDFMKKKTKRRRGSKKRKHGSLMSKVARLWHDHAISDFPPREAAMWHEHRWHDHATLKLS